MPRFIFLFFFLSGFSALIYEVSWVRQLSLTLGNTAAATSTVLAVFLGGLAIGAYWGGKFADRPNQRSLLTYGYLEVGVGISALAVSEILRRSDVMYKLLYETLPPGEVGLFIVRLIISSALLLVPTLLMGATLPVLVRFLKQYNQSQKMFSSLYGINTLGAAAGSLTACFLGFSYIGLQGTVFCAVAINLIIGGFSIHIGKSADADASVQAQSEEHPTVQQETDTQTSVSLPMLYAIGFMTGLTALGYEVLWTRILRWSLTSMTYSFTIMISTFLLGLAIGSFIYEHWMLKIGTVRKRPFLTLGIVQYLAAIACAASLHVMVWSPRLIDPLHKMGWFPDRIVVSHPIYQILYILAISSITILPAAIFIGLLFPILGTAAAGRQDKTATAVGTVYAFNTLGCICGSLICGFVLIPMVGSYNTFQLIVVVSTLTGAAAIFCAEQLLRATRMAMVCLPIFLALIYVGTIRILTKDPPGRITLAKDEDYNSAMTVYNIPSYDAVQLCMNGCSLASTIPPGRRYMRLMGHLPVLLHKNPERVLVACYGTGTTCGAVSIHPEVKRLDLVELSKMVIGSAPYFHRTNFNALQNPKTNLHINDVRNYLLTDKDKYDVITFEPPPPSDAGIVNLYTEEFYELVQKHLNTNGIMCQWVPMQQQSLKLWKMMVITARTIFPYVSIWMPNTQQALIVASMEPLDIDCARMQARINAAPQVQESLDDVGLGSAMAVLSTFVVEGEPLDEFVKDVPSITDNYPSLEFFIPHAGKAGKELEIEAVGLRQLNQLVTRQSHAKGFNKEEFTKNWQAINLLRQLETTNSPAQGDRCIDAAANLLPNSKWLYFVKTHRDSFRSWAVITKEGRYQR